MIRVVNVFDLMKVGRFVRHQECDYLKYPDASSMVVLFSHRWEKPENPDPRGIQYHGAVRFAIQLCMMVCGSTPNVFNSVDFSEMIANPKLVNWLTKEYQSFSASLRTPMGMAALQDDKDLPEKSMILGRYLIDTIGLENTRKVIMDVVVIAWLMRKLDFWYDFSCMPQRPRSAEQEVVFQRELKDLNRYFSEYPTCIHWSSKDLKRAWCLMEGLISLRSDRHSVFCTENSLISSDECAEIHEAHFGETMLDESAGPLDVRQLGQDSFQLHRRNQKIGDLSLDLSYRLNNEVRSVGHTLRGKTSNEILDYLEKNGYSTTEEEDMSIIANSLAIHLM